MAKISYILEFKDFFKENMTSSCQDVVLGAQTVAHPF